MPILISGTPTNPEELRAIGEKAIAKEQEAKEGGNTIKEPKEVKSKSKEAEESAVEVEEELKSFKFYDTDTGITHEIIEGQEAIIETWTLKNRGKWTINYVPPNAYFSLDYGLWSSFYLGHWLPSFDKKKMKITPDDTIKSEEVKAGALETETPASITQEVFAGSSDLKYTAIALLGGVILGLLLRSRKII